LQLREQTPQPRQIFLSTKGVFFLFIMPGLLIFSGSFIWYKRHSR